MLILFFTFFQTPINGRTLNYFLSDVAREPGHGQLRFFSASPQKTKHVHWRHGELKYRIFPAGTRLYPCRYFQHYIGRDWNCTLNVPSGPLRNSVPASPLTNISRHKGLNLKPYFSRQIILITLYPQVNNLYYIFLIFYRFFFFPKQDWSS
jgi:hypothetical protein